MQSEMAICYPVPDHEALIWLSQPRIGLSTCDLPNENGIVAHDAVRQNFVTELQEPRRQFTDNG
jgi:hypothetical protein